MSKEKSAEEMNNDQLKTAIEAERATARRETDFNQKAEHWANVLRYRQELYSRIALLETAQEMYRDAQGTERRGLE